MKINEVFKTDISIRNIKEDIRANGHLSKNSPEAFMKKMQDLFKVEAETPEQTVKKVIHMLLDKKTRTTQMYLNGVMQGATQAGVRVDFALRQAVDRYLEEGMIAFLAQREPIIENIDPEGASELHGVLYNQRTGLGSSPYNEDVCFFGTPVLMTPSKFLALALPLTHPTSVPGIKKELAAKQAIASPYLLMNLSRDGDGKVVTEGAEIIGHDGRNRAQAILEQYGDVEMLVHIIYQGGVRAKHVSPELLESVNKRVKSEGGAVKTGPFWKPLT
jgi:hypothetical protein